MFDVPSFRVGKLFGIPVEINLSWLVIFLLVSFTLSTSYFPSIPAAQGSPVWLFALVGSVTALAFFASVLAHELCHSLVIKLSGGKVDRITLFIFGGVAQMDEEPETPGREFLMASAGPAMSLVIAAVCFASFSLAVSRGLAWWVWAPLQYLSAINLGVGLFNLLPGFPLDGGRVLRSLLWALTHDILKATRWASRSGQFIGWAMVAFAVAGVLGGQTGLIWFGLVGWFIASLAGQAYRQQEVRSRLEGLVVRSVMTPSPVHVDGDMTLQTLVQTHFLGGHHTRYPVMYAGSITGLVTLSEVKAVAQPDWPYVSVNDVVNRDLDQLVVAADAPVELLVRRLAGDKPGALLVVEDGRMVGIVTRADVLSLLERTSD
jgi:Zn-dependent protease/predicted transcriptional regulator